MKRCYLAGPMRKFKNLNYPEFNRVAKLLAAAGWDVISPANLDREANEPWTSQTDPDYADETHPFTPQDCRRTVRRDMEVLMGLRSENGDCIILMPGWRSSTGGVGEAAVSRWLFLGVHEFVENFHDSRVPFWLRSVDRIGDE